MALSWSYDIQAYCTGLLGGFIEALRQAQARRRRGRSNTRSFQLSRREGGGGGGGGVGETATVSGGSEGGGGGGVIVESRRELNAT